MKKWIAAVLLVSLLLAALPMQVLAGENADAVLELSRKGYILDLVGREGSPAYRSGAKLSKNMNAAQVESCLNELLNSNIEGILRYLEDLVTYGLRSSTAENLDISYDEVIGFLTDLRTIWMEAKTYYDIIEEDRAFILSTTEALEQGGVYITEHDIETAAHQVLQRTSDLEKQIAAASDCYEEWIAVIDGARKRLLEDAAEGDPSDELQMNIVRLRTGRAEEMQQIAALEPSNGGKDIIIDVVSIYEIRIYALDENGDPLKDAVVYCWPVNDSNPDRNKGAARIPNDEGYVTVKTAELGADENHYMTAGYEIVCPGYRTQYAQANYIKGAEIFWCYLQKEVPGDNVYVAGISLNGYDCKWYEKELYITDENNADQTVEIFLRSQDGSDFNGTALMTYVNRDAEAAGSETTVLRANYEGKNGEGSAVFRGKYCQLLAGGQENAMTFQLSSSAANDVIKPKLKSEDARIKKTEYVQNDAILDALGAGSLSFSWPGDVPFLNNMSLNFDISNILTSHVYVLTNCSGLWAVVASTNQQPVLDSVEKLNNSWMTEDSKKIEAFTNSEFNKFAGFTKQEVENEYKMYKYQNRIPGTYGGKQLYGSASLAVFGNYAEFKELDFTAVVGLQVGFRGDWTKQLFLGVIPINVGWGFDLSASVFFKFDFTGWEYDGVDISAAVRFLGYMSGGPGISMTFLGKTFTAGLGFKFSLSMMVGLPIFSSLDGPEEDPKFSFSIGLSFYASFFFASFTWNMWSGSGELNMRTGKFNFTSKPFWKSTVSEAALKEASGISLDPEEGSGIREEIVSQDEINGDTRWEYNAYEFSKEADAAPTYFTLHWEDAKLDQYKSDVDYLFWVEDGRRVNYTLTNYSQGYEQSFRMPGDVQKKLDSGEWKVTGVRAAAHPQLYYVHVRMGGTDTVQKVQLATVTVTIGTDWVTQSEKVGDETVTRRLPTGTVSVTRVFLFDGTMKQLQYLGSDDSLHDVLYVHKVNEPLSDVIGMIYRVTLMGYSPAGTTQLIEDIVMKDSSGETTLTMYATSDKPENPGMVAFLAQNPGETAEEVGVKEMGVEGKPVKQIVGGSGMLGFLIVLTDEGKIFHISPERYRHWEITGGVLTDIGDIAMVRTASGENEWSDYTLFCTKKAQADGGSTPLQSVILHGDDFGEVDLGEFTDYDVDLGGAPIFAGRLLDENYLYWFETFSDEEGKTNYTAVRGMCYSPKYNMMTSPFRLGVLDGDDGTKPAGCSSTSEPIVSRVMSNGDMLITKAWLPDSDDDDGGETFLSTYKVSVVRRVCGELIGAGTEMPAVSAGRNCNMLFTVINKGNVPILGFDFDIYHNNAQGVRELVQSSHVDVTDQTNNRVTYLKTGYSEAKPIVFTGESSARRISGLFDMINGDSWNVTRSQALTGENGTAPVNGSVFVNIPALMPEGIHTYTMVFAVPIDWANKTEITCEISNTYVPENVADVFALSDSVGANDADRAGMRVLSVSGVQNANARRLKAGEGMQANVAVAGTLNGFSAETALQSGGKAVVDANGVQRVYTFKPGIRDVEFDVVNLSLKCRVFERDGRNFVTITVFQDGQTDHAAARGVTLKAWVDDEQNPSYVYTFTTHHDDGQMAYSITLPERTLTNGRYADRLTISVSDTVDENQEMSEIDDTCVLELNQSLRLKSLPQNAVVLPGMNAAFAVEAEGGHAPYRYTWQKIENGKWTDLQAEGASSFTLENVTAEMNGTFVRCVVEDAMGERIESDPALLTVIGDDVILVNDGKPFVYGEAYEIEPPVICDEKGVPYDPQPEMKVEYYRLSEDGESLEAIAEKPEDEGTYFAVFYIPAGMNESGSRVCRFTIGHLLVKIDGKAATREEAGYKAYYFCESCGKYFEDEEGKTEIPDLEKWKSEGGNGYLPKIDDPATGDQSNPGLWILLVLVSVLGLAACVTLGKKKIRGR